MCLSLRTVGRGNPSPRAARTPSASLQPERRRARIPWARAGLGVRLKPCTVCRSLTGWNTKTGGTKLTAVSWTGARMGFVVPISVRPGCCSGSMAGARPRQRRALPGEGRRLCDQVRIRGDAIKSLHTFWLWRFIGPATAAPGLVCARTALTALAPGCGRCCGGAAAAPCV